MSRPAPLKLPVRVSIEYVEDSPVEYKRARIDLEKYYKDNLQPLFSSRNWFKSHKMVEIIEGVWLGNANDAMDIEQLRAYNIGSVVNCASNSTLTCRDYYPEDIVYNGLECEDSDSYDILGKHHKEFIEMMDVSEREKRSVLVHCVAGINRSACLLISYMIARKKYSLIDAIKHCYERRPIILTNSHFVYSLIDMFL